MWKRVSCLEFDAHSVCACDYLKLNAATCPQCTAWASKNKTRKRADLKEVRVVRSGHKKPGNWRSALGCAISRCTQITEVPEHTQLFQTECPSCYVIISGFFLHRLHLQGKGRRMEEIKLTEFKEIISITDSIIQRTTNKKKSLITNPPQSITANRQL